MRIRAVRLYGITVTALAAVGGILDDLLRKPVAVIVCGGEKANDTG